MMFDYTYNNYLKFGYDNQSFNIRKNKNSILWCNFGPTVRPAENFYEENLRSAKFIREKTNQDLYVLLSGGMDSEIVLRSFIDAGLEVNAISVAFENQSNEHDLYWAKKFCEERKINHKIVPLNLRDFLSNQASSYALQTGCTSPQFCVLMWLMDQTPGLPIIGSGDSAIKRVENTNQFLFHEYENYLCLYNYLIQNKKEGVPAFLQYTPEQLISFFQHPVLKEYINGKAKEKKILSISKYKFEIYKYSYPDLVNRPIYNGYENIQYLDESSRKHLEQICEGGGQRLSFYYDDFCREMVTTGSKTDQTRIQEY